MWDISDDRLFHPEVRWVLFVIFYCLRFLNDNVLKKPYIIVYNGTSIKQGSIFNKQTNFTTILSNLSNNWVKISCISIYYL